MLEGVGNTVYGNDAAHAKRLATVGGSVHLATAAETALTVASANEYGYLVHLRADCVTAGTAAGTWTLRLAMGGSSVLVLQQPVAISLIGTSYCWPFPVPWKTTAHGDVFTIKASAVTIGIWQFTCNGFYSAL